MVKWTQEKEVAMKKRKILRRGLCVLSACLLLVLCAPAALAIEPQYKVSSAYKSSTYHQNLRALPLVGDGAFDTLSAALSQYSYHEGSGSADFHGGNTASTGNYTEYGYAYGKVNGTYGYAWCAVFVSWCMQQAGEAESAGGAFASCSLWVARLKELGQYTARSAHTPKMGDLIFFRSAGVGRVSDHVGLVRYVKNGRVYTVEGNSSGQVALRDYALGDTYIVGYGRPQYQNGTKGILRTAHEDQSAGHYIVTYDFLNVRAASSSSSAKKGSLSKGDMVRVREVKNGWGRIEYKGDVAYISLDYADFVAPSSHTLSYRSEGKTIHSAAFFSTDGHKVAAFTPEREGYEFVGWQDVQQKEYQSGAAVGAEDLVLSAVWRELPPPPPPVEENPEDIPVDIPGDGMSDAPPTGESVPESIPDALPPDALAPQDPDLEGAALAAGILTFLVAAAWIGAFVWLKYKKKEE